MNSRFDSIDATSLRSKDQCLSNLRNKICVLGQEDGEVSSRTNGVSSMGYGEKKITPQKQNSRRMAYEMSVSPRLKARNYNPLSSRYGQSVYGTNVSQDRGINSHLQSQNSQQNQHSTTYATPKKIQNEHQITSVNNNTSKNTQRTIVTPKATKREALTTWRRMDGTGTAMREKSPITVVTGASDLNQAAYLFDFAGRMDKQNNKHNVNYPMNENTDTKMYHNIVNNYSENIVSLQSSKKKSLDKTTLLGAVNRCTPQKAQSIYLQGQSWNNNLPR